MPVDMKAMIAGTYLQLVQHGNVDKITVKALIDACHISRQTFYYHFRDIMDVLEWSIQRETARLVEETLQVEGMGQALKLFISFAVERFPCCAGCWIPKSGCSWRPSCWMRWSAISARWQSSGPGRAPELRGPGGIAALYRLRPGGGAAGVRPQAQHGPGFAGRPAGAHSLGELLGWRSPDP